MTISNRFPSLILASDNPADAPGRMHWSAPITIEAADDNDDTTPRFTVHAYTGGVMRLPYIYLPVVLDLTAQRKTSGQVKTLRNHDQARILGHAENVEVTEKGIFIAGVFSGEDAEVDQVVGPSKRGFQWEASIGASGERFERLEQGKSATVNGRTVTGPLIIVRQWALKEVSFVAIGADENTTTKIAAAGSGDDDMNFEQWIQAHGFDPTSIIDEFKQTLRAQYDAELKAAGGDASKINVPKPARPQPENQPQLSPSPQPVQANGDQNNNPAQPSHASPQQTQDVTASIRQEHTRIAEINRICAQHPNMTVKDDSGNDVSLAAHAINAGWDSEKVELHVLRAARPSAPGMIVRDNQQLNAQAVEAALCASAGFDRTFLEGQFNEQTLDAADDRHLRGIGIQGLMRLTLAANGGHANYMNVGSDMIEATLRADPMLNGHASINAAGGMSTISLSGILSNLANKAMLERYEQAESVWPEIASETSTNNFKPFTRYRLDSAGQMHEVGPDGELKHIELAETEFSNQLKTQGGIIALTREMMINDELGAFLQLPQIFGELNAYAIEETTFKRILAGIGSFFSAGNNNYIDGAATELSIEGLSKAKQTFRQQKGPGGRLAMLRPALLLVGSANEAVADQIFTSTQLGDGSSTKQKPKDNPHRNKFKPVVSPFLDAGVLTGGSDKHWGLLSKPTAGSGVVQVGFLNGRRQPVIESANANFSQLGIQFRSYHDFGIREFDPRAGVWSKGEA